MGAERENMLAFIKEHLNDNTHELLLKAAKYPDIDMPQAVDQIVCRKLMKDKLPDWYENGRVIFPSRVSAEQCSSEKTALYKQRLIDATEHVLCDLTGGMGVDSFYFSKVLDRVVYIERFENYCACAKENFKELGALNIDVHNGDSSSLFPTIGAIDVFYIDPARRGEGNKRLFAIEDCEPNVLELKDELLNQAKKVIIKLSPMVDITHSLSKLPEATAVHVVSVKNECKELLLVLEKGVCFDKPVEVMCVNFTTDGEEQCFVFTPDAEQQALVVYAEKMRRYLYEPNASVMKAGAFKSIAHQLGLEKLQVSSHLYTSDVLLPDFPGRTFEVEEVLDFSGKTAKKLSTQIPKANIAVRNFPLDVNELRKKTKIKEGGDVYLFATTLQNDDKVILKCSKV
ncbi:MAG: THUMP-like domain-containing protein [Tannerellaceae bacterium]